MHACVVCYHAVSAENNQPKTCWSKQSEYLYMVSLNKKNLQAVAQHRAQASQAKKGTRKFVDSEGEYVVVFVS